MKTYSYIQYDQPGGSFYACTMKASEIINRLEVRRRSDNSELGIQRDEDKKRIKDIEGKASNFRSRAWPMARAT